MRRGNSATTGDELLMTPLYEGTAAPPFQKVIFYFITLQFPLFIRSWIFLKFTL